VSMGALPPNLPPPTRHWLTLCALNRRAITSAGGRALAEARKALPTTPSSRGGVIRCKTGDARTTVGGDLACEWVIHAVGPNYRMVGDEDEADALLFSAYLSAMREARGRCCPSVAFSLLSAGIFRGPRSLRHVLALGLLAVDVSAYEALEDVFLVGYTREEVETLTELLQELFGPAATEARSQFLAGLGPKVQALHEQAVVSRREAEGAKIGFSIAHAATVAICK
jgi:O-acetyl-ADP-ribose deacetylase (regulator of RNase III)